MQALAQDAVVWATQHGLVRAAVTRCLSPVLLHAGPAADAFISLSRPKYAAAQHSAVVEQLVTGSGAGCHPRASLVPTLRMPRTSCAVVLAHHG